MSAEPQVRLLLSSGRRPEECHWAVTELRERLEQEARQLGVTVRRLGSVPGTARGTHRSVLLQIAGPGALRFARSWSGTLCWQAPSPYRSDENRKNWYVMAEVQGERPDRPVFSEADVEVVPVRTGGPGGQHRDKASTAVRATHRPSGTVVVVDTERRFSDNRRLALVRLRGRIDHAETEAELDAAAARWRTHDQLARYHPTRIEHP